MAGFDNNVMYADNVDFTGSTTPVAQVTADGEILIGSTVAPNIRVGSLASAGASLIFTVGAGTINIETAGTIAASFPTDAGTAVPAVGALTVAGGTGITTAGAGSTVTISVDGAVVGQTITGDNGGALSPTAGNWNIVGGTGITTTGVGSTLTIDSSGGFTWVEVTGTSVGLLANTGYILNNVGLVTATLPALCEIGDTFQIVGKGAGGWRVAQNAGDTIHFGNQDTTTGVVGMLDSTNQYDCIEFVCTVVDLDWTVVDSVGNITVT